MPHWLCQNLSVSGSQQTVKFLERWEYQTTLPASWEIYIQVKKQQLELDMEQETGSKSGKEYLKAVYCHPACLTYMQSTSYEMLGWTKHRLESRLLGKISVISDTQMTPPLWQKVKKNSRVSWWKWKRIMKKLRHYLANKNPSSQSYGFSSSHVWMWELDIKNAEHLRIDALELWCWRRLLRVPWTARRSNQSIIKEISPGCSLEGLMLKLKFQCFGHVMQRADSLEKTLMLGKIEGRWRRGR